MEEWLRADPTWRALGFASRKAFLGRFLVRARFCPGVPKDVRDAYHTVERMMAYSYYHYPLYDEACRRVLGIFEMAVTIRAVQLLESKGHEVPPNRKFTLNAKIELISAEPIYAYFRSQLHLIRDFRNSLSHPTDHSFMGGMNLRPIIAIVNVINFIFLDMAQVGINQRRSRELSALFGPFTDGPVVIEAWGKRIVTDGFGFDAMLEIGGSEVCLCWFSVVSELTLSRLKDSVFEEPVVLRLEDLRFLDGKLEARERGTGDLIVLHRGLTSGERDAYERFFEGFAGLEEIWRFAFMDNNKVKLARAVEDFIYELSCQSYT
ncbi:MAG: hypothetical protein REI78_02770 [Pedobacter sp.]|nr:hypothetical protein [Pedobacter sp.]